MTALSFLKGQHNCARGWFTFSDHGLYFASRVEPYTSIVVGTGFEPVWQGWKPWILTPRWTDQIKTMMEYPSRSNLNSFFWVFSGPWLGVLNSDSTLDCRHPLSGENHCFCSPAWIWTRDHSINSRGLYRWATEEFTNELTKFLTSAG